MTDVSDWVFLIIGCFCSAWIALGLDHLWRRRSEKIEADLKDDTYANIITDNPSEWTYHGTDVFEGGGVWQSKKNPNAFSEDGGKSYYLINEGAHHGKPTTRHISLAVFKED